MTDRFRTLCLAVAVCLSLGGPAASRAQMPIFPGAEGYGGTFSGAAPAGGWLSNATVYHVTNLNDSGAGSFRGAFQENTANRIIVFDVAGTINLTSGAVSIKNLANYYIAGQTAPGPVTIYGDTVQLSHSSGKENRNVALRYLSFRKGTGGGEDALTFSGGGLGTNLILDHVSASWAEDEVLSVANNNTNVTVQYSTIHDALVSNHAYGSLIRPQIDSNVSFHHNLYAHNASRQARFGTYNSETLTADFRNNVVYNWRDRASYAGGSSDPEREFADVNYVGNYLIAGPGTTGSATRAFTVDRNIDVRLYQSGNFIDSDKAFNPGSVPNGSLAAPSAFALGSLGSPPQTLTQMAAPFPLAPVTTQTAPAAYLQIVDHVGNWWWNRDAIDSRVVGNLLTNQGPPIGLATPNATELSNLLAAPMATHPAAWDSDNDGMPNAWELAHGLNPNSPGATPDWKLDFDYDGYINLLEYVNERGEFPAPAPIVFTGGVGGRYAEIANWRTEDGVTAGSNWQPSKYDDVEIRSGTVTVDAVGQHASSLRVGTLLGPETTTLAVTGGWLEAFDVNVGEGALGVVNHSGGELRTNELFIAGNGTYNLSAGGRLRAEQLLKSGNGDFNFIGGVLSADMIGFDLVNQGGVIAPGDSPGEMHVMGDLTLSGGVLEIEIGGTSVGQFDRVEVDGFTTLGGMLKVELADLGGGAYVPQLGDTFGFLAAFGGAVGDFDNFDLPELAPGLAWGISPGDVTVFLSVVSATGNPADFNGDGLVDGGDLSEWTQGFGLAGQPDNSTGDADGDGDVDGGDFLVWQRELGSGANAAVASTIVPEPASWLLGLVASLLLLGYYRGVRVVAPATR